MNTTQRREALAWAKAAGFTGALLLVLAAIVLAGVYTTHLPH